MPTTAMMIMLGGATYSTSSIRCSTYRTFHSKRFALVDKFLQWKYRVYQTDVKT